MKFIKEPKDIPILIPEHINYQTVFFGETFLLLSVGYESLCSIDDSYYLLKNINTGEIIKVTNAVYNHLIETAETMDNWWD